MTKETAIQLTKIEHDYVHHDIAGKSATTYLCDMYNVHYFMLFTRGSE